MFGIESQRRRQLMRVARQQFRLEWQGIHGVPHWARVRWNGLTLAAVNGARVDVVEVFALLHDSHRHHDGPDREHGARAADFALKLSRELLQLDRSGLELPMYAMRYHSDGLIEADLTDPTDRPARRHRRPHLQLSYRTNGTARVAATVASLEPPDEHYVHTKARVLSSAWVAAGPDVDTGASR